MTTSEQMQSEAGFASGRDQGLEDAVDFVEEMADELFCSTVTDPVAYMQEIARRLRARVR